MNMKTLYLSRSYNIVVNAENNEVSQIKSIPSGINNVYYVTEPMHVSFGYEDDKAQTDVVPGDIIIVFYRDEFPNKFIVVKNDDWSENAVKYFKKEEEIKERWAQQKIKLCEDCNNCNACEDCDNC